MLLRKLLYRVLPHHLYMRFVRDVFIRTYLWGLYIPQHVHVRFLQKILQPGDVCIDIGANLGYFSVMASRCCGDAGSVYAVEPVPAFRSILEGHVKRFSADNVTIHPYALGDQDNHPIQMVTAKEDGIARHGQTAVADGESQGDLLYHEAVMMRPDTLYGELERLDFIKCDVEGYELHIIPHLLSLLERFHPVLEIEIDAAEHKQKIIEMLEPYGYRPHHLLEGSLTLFTLDDEATQGVFELYFITERDQHLTASGRLD